MVMAISLAVDQQTCIKNGKITHGLDNPTPKTINKYYKWSLPPPKKTYVSLLIGTTDPGGGTLIASGLELGLQVLEQRPEPLPSFVSGYSKGYESLLNGIRFVIKSSVQEAKEQSLCHSAADRRTGRNIVERSRE